MEPFKLGEGAKIMPPWYLHKLYFIDFGENLHNFINRLHLLWVEKPQPFIKLPNVWLLICIIQI